MKSGRTRGPNRPSGKFVRHDWMWLWMAGSRLKQELTYRNMLERHGGNPIVRIQFQSDDVAVRTAVSALMVDDERQTEQMDDDVPYDIGAAIKSAREKLDEEVKDACSVAAENLEEYRRLRGFTTAQAGEVIGVNESTFRSKMRAVENMRLGEFLALCATLEVDPGVALGFIDGEDASSLRLIHRLGAVEDHRYIGELAEFLSGKTGSTIPRHAVVPHALADQESSHTGDKTEADDQWPRWFETDESYDKYGPYFRAERRDDDDSSPYGITGYYMYEDASIYDFVQEEADKRLADEVSEYFESQGIGIQRLGAGRLVVRLDLPEDGEVVEDDSN